jgi:hypothetical protein
LERIEEKFVHTETPQNLCLLLGDSSLKKEGIASYPTLESSLKHEIPAVRSTLTAESTGYREVLTVAGTWDIGQVIVPSGRRSFLELLHSFLHSKKELESHG